MFTLITPLVLPPPSVILGMKINEEGQKRSVENGIEAPTPDPGAPESGEMVIQHPNRHQKAKHELHNLTVGHPSLPPRPDPQCAQEVVGVH